MEQQILNHLITELPSLGMFVFIAYYMIKSQFCQLKKEIERLEKERRYCEASCKEMIKSYDSNAKNLEAAVNKGFEEVKVAIAEIKTELRLYK